jgi:hypothetical protein
MLASFTFLAGDHYPPGTDATTRVDYFENGPTREFFNPIYTLGEPGGLHRGRPGDVQAAPPSRSKKDWTDDHQVAPGGDQGTVSIRNAMALARPMLTIAWAIPAG